MIDTYQVEPSSTRLTRVKTILVVEDDPIIGELLVNAIEQETPYHARLALDGYEALHMVGGMRPALFLLDYRMPHMDGFALYDHLHARVELVRVPALLISASFPYELEAAMESRHLTLLRKPFMIDDFLRSIEGILH